MAITETKPEYEAIKTVILVRVTDEMRAKLGVLRGKTGLSMSAICRLAIKEYLAKQ